MEIPKRLTIETIFGCNASCSMCVINTPTKRKKGVMPLEMSNKIMDELAIYTDKIKMLDLFGLGEPLLDPHIFERIRYAKQKGFQSIAISTNADLLDEEKQKKLLDSGIDAVLFSIDGVKKETHENIRKGVTFEKVVENVKSIIKMRDKMGYNTRFIVRFIKQENNKDQWEAYKTFWKPLLTKDKDLMIIYDMHTWGGEISTKDSLLNKEKDPEIEKKPCHHLQNLIILSDGSVPLCSEDFLHARHNFGNVKDQPALEIFNCPKFKAIREKHNEGNKNTMIPCKECTVLYSEKTRKDEKI
ncbi:MAG: radical SAM protein [Nanoarchaeota archaeon]|nr:radical SAM protein [Nanoarchaeota archaeon]